MARQLNRTHHFENFSACEIIQEIYGLGPYRLLHENEDEIFERLMFRYDKHSSDSDLGTEESAKNHEVMELLIRRTLAYRKAEATGSYPSRKEAIRSVPRSSGGHVDKVGADSARAARKISLG